MEAPDLSTILVFTTGVLAGVIAALKIIAPKTKTLKDDKALDVMEKAKEVLDAVTPKAPKAPVKAG